MATFDGNDMGPCFVRTSGNPTQLQIFSYPGINGIGANILGSRGGRTEATGVLYATTVAGLATLEGTFRGLQLASTAATLVDTESVSWDGVILTSYEPDGEISEAPGFGYARAYRMEFLHTG